MKQKNLYGIIKGILEIHQGGIVRSNVVYPHGEMDLLHIDRLGIRTYYEIKSTTKEKQVNKGISQVKRAIKYGQCEYGYVVTPNSWYHVK